MNDDRTDELIRDAARSYHEPPPTPRDRIWERIQAAREARKAAPGVIRLTDRRPALVRYRPWLAAAAVLVVGVAIGRLSRTPTPRAPATIAAGESAGGSIEPNAAVRFAAIEHLSRVETLITEYRTRETDQSVGAVARDLLSQTRLWLDAGTITDPGLRALLEDLELVLVQIAQLAPNGQSEEREIIDEGMAERQIRTRLRAAIPAGPTA